MATGIAYFRALARLLYEDLNFVITGTATTSTTTTTLYDTAALKYSSFDASLYDRKWLYAMAAADASTLGYSQLTAGGWSGSAGTLALDSAITGFAEGALYVITNHRPAVLQNALKAVFRNMYEPSYFPLSLHIVTNDCNDMEASTVATDYTPLGAGTTAAAETTKVYSGGQSLKVTATTGTVQYVRTADIPVNASQTLYAAVMNAVDSGDSAEFRIVNKDSADAIIESATNDEIAWMELVFPFTPPTGCERVQAWMISTANTDVSYWDQFQIWASGEHVYSLPSFVTRKSELIDVRSWPQGTGGPASDLDYRADEQRSHRLTWGWEQADPRGKLRIWVDCDSGRPFIVAKRALAELSSDTVSSVANIDNATRWAARYIEAEGAEAKARVLALLRGSYLAGLRVVAAERVGIR